jgi:hypothetical protein
MSHAGDPTALTTGEPAHAAPAAPTDSAPAAQAAPAVADDTDDNRGNLVAADAPDDNVGNTVAAAPKPADDEEDGPAPGNELHPAPKAAARPQGEGGERGKKRRGKKPEGAEGTAAPRERGERGERNGQGHKGAAADAQHRAFKVGDKVRAKILSRRPGGRPVRPLGQGEGRPRPARARRADMAEAEGGRRRSTCRAAGRRRGGNLVVTRDPPAPSAAARWSCQAFNAGEPIEALVTGYNKGGLELDIERRAGLLPELAGRRAHPLAGRAPGDRAAPRALQGHRRSIDGGREASCRAARCARARCASAPTEAIKPTQGGRSR